MHQSLLAIHGDGRGLVCLERERGDEYFLKPESVKSDDYQRFSLARFTLNRQRSIAELMSLSAVSVALRPAAPGRPLHIWQNTSDPASVAAELIERVGIRAKPTITAEDGGLRVTISHDHLPGRAAPRWRALQHEFAQQLDNYGAVDDSRITQLIPAGKILIAGERTNFERLCGLLPLSRDECRDARRRTVENAALGGWVARLWWRRLAEMREFVRTVWPGGAPAEHRHQLLWLMSNAMGWAVADARELPGEIRVLAAEIGVPPEYVDAATREIRERMKKDPAGRGKLYKYSDEQLAVELTGRLGQAERDTWLAIDSKGLSDRQRPRAVIHGRQVQQAIAEDERYIRAAELGRSGMSTRKIATEVNLSQSAVSRYLRRVRGESPAM